MILFNTNEGGTNRMKLRPDARSEAIKRIQNNFNGPFPSYSFSNAMIEGTDSKQSASLSSMQVQINYETFAPKNHLE